MGNKCGRRAVRVTGGSWVDILMFFFSSSCSATGYNQHSNKVIVMNDGVQTAFGK